MTASQLILPGRSAGRTTRAVNAWFLWKASELSVDALTGQMGVLTKPATLVEVDNRLATWSSVANQPAWGMAGAAYDKVGLRLDGVSDLHWLTQMPNPPMANSGGVTVYCELDPLWARTGSVGSNLGIAKVGMETGDFPTVGFSLYRASGSANINLVGYGGSLNFRSLAASIPASGNVKILAWLAPGVSSGFRWHLQVNTSAIQTDTADNTMATDTWSAQRVALNEAPNVAPLAQGDARYLKLAVVGGVHTMAEMEAL